MFENHGGLYDNSRRVTRDPKFHDYDLERGDDNNLFARRSTLSSSSGSDDLSLKPTSEYIKERPHLLDKATMNRLRQLLVLGASSGAFPWTWNKKEYRIDKWNPTLEKLWKFQWCFVTIQTACLTIFQFYSFFTRVSGTNKSYREVFMNSLSVYWYICAVYFNINMYIYKDQVI